MWLGLLLAACGAEPVVALADAAKGLERAPRVTVEGGVSRASKCSPCPPGADCKPCEKPTLELEKTLRFGLEQHAFLSEGTRVRASLVKRGAALFAECVELVTVCGSGPVVEPEKITDAGIIEGVLESVSSCPPCPPPARCEKCEDPLLVLEPSTLVFLDGYATDLVKGRRYRIAVRRFTRYDHPSLRAQCIEALPKR